MIIHEPGRPRSIVPDRLKPLIGERLELAREAILAARGIGITEGMTAHALRWASVGHISMASEALRKEIGLLDSQIMACDKDGREREALIKERWTMELASEKLWRMHMKQVRKLLLNPAP